MEESVSRIFLEQSYLVVTPGREILLLLFSRSHPKFVISDQPKLVLSLVDFYSLPQGKLLQTF